MPPPYSHPKATKVYNPASSSGTVINKPAYPQPSPNPEGFGKMTNAQINDVKGYKNASTDADTQAAINHRDSVLADPFNKLHYGENEVDRAVADSIRTANNIEAMKESPATGAEQITAKPIGKARFPNFGQPNSTDMANPGEVR